MFFKNIENELFLINLNVKINNEKPPSYKLEYWLIASAIAQTETDI